MLALNIFDFTSLKCPLLFADSKSSNLSRYRGMSGFNKNPEFYTTTRMEELYISNLKFQFCIVVRSRQTSYKREIIEVNIV